MERLTLFLMKPWWWWLSCHWVMPETKLWGWDSAHWPLNHTEDPQGHKWKIPELGSHERTTHHPPLAWQLTKFPNQQGSASRFSPIKMCIWDTPCACHKTQSQSSRCSIYPCFSTYVFYFILTRSWCNRQGNWSFNSQYSSYTHLYLSWH